mgnify:FL=1
MSQFISIKYKLALVYLAFIAEIFLVIILIRQFWTIPQFLHLEQIADHKDLIRIENTLNSKIDELALVNYDNAVWDDSYQFVQDGNPEFIEENFVEDTFRSLDINGIYYFNNQGRIVWGEAYRRSDWTKITMPFLAEPPPWFLKSILIDPTEVRNNNNHPVTHKGILFIENRPIIFTATSLLPSEGKGNSRGTLLFYRNVLPKNELEIAELGSLDATFIWPSHPDHPALLAQYNNDVLLSSRNNQDELTLVSFDFLNQTPYFVKLQASSRAFDGSLFDISLIAALAFSLFGILFLFYFVSKRLIGPITRWNRKISTIVNEGNYTIRFTAKGNDELSAFSKSFNQLLEYVEQQDKEIKLHNRELMQLSHTDGLTKLYNRRYFDNEVHSMWDRATHGGDICLFMIDIDYFKQYNDNYGHQQGDIALQRVAQSLMENTKRSTDLVARYGGEEFVIILKNTKLADGRLVAQNLCKFIFNLSIEHQYSPLERVTISIGVTSAPLSIVSSPRQLIHQADEALYRAKKLGRNQVCIFNDEE